MSILNSTRLKMHAYIKLKHISLGIVRMRNGMNQNIDFTYCWQIWYSINEAFLPKYLAWGTKAKACTGGSVINLSLSTPYCACICNKAYPAPFTCTFTLPYALEICKYIYNVHEYGMAVNASKHLTHFTQFLHYRSTESR